MGGGEGGGIVKRPGLSICVEDGVEYKSLYHHR